MKIDKNLIKELSEYLEEFKLTEIEFTEKDTKIKVSKNNTSFSNQISSITQDSSSIQEKIKTSNKASVGTEITSPIIRTAYHAPEPGAKKIIEVGKKFGLKKTLRDRSVPIKKEGQLMLLFLL